jgi:acyl phosphate:glycerol-3-phosphate acyltransferase
MITSTLVIIGGYLLGSVASAIIICRMLGLPDPREGGSGNPGATNVLRLGGRKAGAMTLAGDVFKGVLPVLIARALGESEWVVAATAVAAFLGHLYPIFFRFQGGKGFATAIGAIAALSWLTFIGMGLTWLAVAGLSRYASLASLVASALAPVYAWFITGRLEWVVAMIVLAVFSFVRHRGNIERLIAGTESRIGDKAKAKESEPVTQDTQSSTESSSAES